VWVESLCHTIESDPATESVTDSELQPFVTHSFTRSPWGLWRKHLTWQACDDGWVLRRGHVAYFSSKTSRSRQTTDRHRCFVAAS
jgi:hypothetical protein